MTSMGKGWLGAAIFMLIFGFGLLWRGWAGLFGGEQITGTQATVVGISSIPYSIVLLFVYFRKNR
jgi:divalent metal cation (Fe/Co/Zn/Cd) transporter